MKKIFTFILTALTVVGFAQDPTTSAGTPSQAASDVISIYSDAYTGVSGTDFYPNWGQATQFTPFTLGADNMLKYTSLNYQGINFSQQDVSGKGFLHLDVWTPANFDLQIFCISATPQNEKKVVRTIVANQWNSFDIDLAEFTSQGLSVASLYQFKFEDAAGTGTMFLDNIYFHGEPSVTEPSIPAPDPMANQLDVISIYSQSYDNVAGTNLYPGWGQSTQFEEFVIDMDTMIKYSNLNYQGIEFGSNVDASAMEYLHLDVWTSSVANLDIFPISRTTGEKSVTKALTTAAWTSIDIAVSDFTDQGLSLADLFQFKFVDSEGNNGTIFLDNVYFYTVPVPATAAPNPTSLEQDVISIYGQTYNNIAGTNLFPGWGQTTQFADFVIGTDSMIKYSNLNYQGIEFGADVDASTMDTLLMDVWSASVTNLDIFPISRTPGEKFVTKALESRAWTRVAIPLSDYTSQGLSITDLFQFKFVDGDGNFGTIYLDNIHFNRPETNSIPVTTFDAFRVYPNPAADYVKLEVTAKGGVINNYTIQSINGQTISTKELNSSVVSETINTSGLEAGIYLLQVSTEKGIYTHKLIVQ